MNLEALRWVKHYVLDDGFICLVDAMGDDSSIVQAARVSYGAGTKHVSDDKTLIRYLYRHGHLTPFEMVEFKFLVRCPMDCWRQWIRHRTANVNEYSTRYSEAINSAQKSHNWRSQATGNKQGSGSCLTDWPEGYNLEAYPTYGEDQLWRADPSGHKFCAPHLSVNKYLNDQELELQQRSRAVYEERLKLGVAKEQARKDLPLSTYTEAYWKCDLRNILNFLSLRMDAHAQEEIRLYAAGMYEIVRQVCPIAVEAFDEYDARRRGLLLTGTEVKMIAHITTYGTIGMLTNAVNMCRTGFNKELLLKLTDKALPRMNEDAVQGMFGIDVFNDAAQKVAGWSLPPAKCRERDEALVKFERMGLIHTTDPFAISPLPAEQLTVRISSTEEPSNATA